MTEKSVIYTLLIVSLAQLVLADDLLANWMGRLPVQSLTLSELSLPGTHDTLTYDLSDTISDGALDGYDELSAFLHLVSPLAPGAWIKSLAQTQALNITEQLDNGIRYIDFRMMRERDMKQWYSLHFVESNNVVEVYFQAIRTWLDSHPTEVVIIQCSKHGNNNLVGTEAYPGVSDIDRRLMWLTIESIFSGLLFDNRVSSLNETSITSLVQRNHRAILLMGDYEIFTGSSPLALDSRIIEQGGFEGGANNPAALYADASSQLSVMTTHKASIRQQGKYLMYSMASAETTDQIEQLAFMKFLGFLNFQEHYDKCTADFQLDGCTYCPTDMLQTAQLLAYYNQLIFENAFLNSWELPNAIILDAFDYQGTIRTASIPLTTPATESTARYAYVDTVLVSNVRVACSLREANPTLCDEVKLQLIERRAMYPYRQWDDCQNGRVGPGWPGTPKKESIEMLSV